MFAFADLFFDRDFAVNLGDIQSQMARHSILSMATWKLHIVDKDHA